MSNTQGQRLSGPNLGTYSFDEFDERNQELDRLKEQATAFWEQEKAVLVSHGIQNCRDILDLACGPGVVTREIKSLVPDSHVTGVDLNESLLKVAISDSHQDGCEAPIFRKADCTDLPFEASSFDFVYARFLFQHLSNPVTAVAEIKRVLKPGGRVLIVDVDDRDLEVTPACSSFEQLAKAAGVYQTEGGGNRNVGRTLDGLLKSHHFANVNRQVEVMSSEQIGLESFFRITTQFKIEQLPKDLAAEMRELLPEMRRQLASANATISAGIHVASGLAC
ncbi:MAG: class I SAM-dependent methyltransferase [Rubripirellula sp.]